MSPSIPKPTSLALYEEDFYLWIQQTVEALKQQDFEQIDWEHLIEEIDSMGRSDKRELKRRLLVMIEHLLKLMFWDNEKAQNARGWHNTVIEQRNQMELLLEDSPSLKPWLVEIFAEFYAKARQQTLQKYGLSADLFPEQPPFTLEELLDADWLPD